MSFVRLKISCLFVTMAMSLQVVHGQEVMINARGFLTISGGIANPVGPTSVSGAPSLLANMPAGQTFRVSYITRLKKGFHAGVSGSRTQFEGWTSAQSKELYDTDVSIATLGPVIEYRTWSPVHSWKNRVVVFGSLSPGASLINVDTKDTSEINAGSESIPLNVKSLRFSITSRVGIGYTATNRLGIELAGSYQYTSSDSEIFPDASYSFWTVQLGLTFRVNKDKRYKLLN